MFKKYLEGLVLLVLVGILFTTPSFVAVKSVNADANVRHEWYGTHHFFDSNGNYCYTDNRFTVTEESYNHPEQTSREVPFGAWVKDEDNPDGPPVFLIHGYKTVYEHKDHNMTTNIHRGIFHNYLSGSCN